jgi:TonB family protein
LRIYDEEGPFLKSFKISRRVVVIGRDKSATLRIQDKFISRKHFQVEFLGENKLFLQDLGSANGTFLNGKKVERSKLEDGDEIVVGEKRIVISYKVMKPEKAVAAKKIKDADTSPMVETPFDNLGETEAATEEEISARKAEISTVDEEALPLEAVEKSSVHSRVAEEPGTVKIDARRTDELREEQRTQEESIAKALEVASIRERRREIRSQEMLYEPERGHRLKKVLFFVFAGLIGLALLSFIFKYAGRYFSPEGGKKPIRVAQREDGRKYKKEKLIIPRPDIKGAPTSKKREKELYNEALLRKDLSKSLKKARRREERSRTSSGKTSARRRSLRTPAPQVRRRTTPTPVRTATPKVPDVVDSLKKNEVLAVDLNRASGRLTASRESTSGKTTKMSRDIDIRKVREMLDIDVGLSIMSEEVMLSEKRDVNKFRNNLKKKISNITYCYRDALKTNPRIHGSIKVNFTIGSTGNVTRARVEDSDIRSRALKSCIISRVKGTRFDAPPHDNFMISYTFNFKKGTMDFRR